jgi:TPR repeat protein
VSRDRSHWQGQLSPEAIAIYFERCVWSTEQWCTNLWFEVDHVAGVDEDMAAATQLYSDACAAGDAASCAGLGWLLGFRFQSTPDPRASEMLDRACRAGQIAACRDLASLLLPDTLLATTDDPRLQRVARLYADACTAGDREACTGLADRIRDGRGPAIASNADAPRLFELACMAGDPVGCRGLADLERDGRGVPVDLALAERHYRLACARREMFACFELAMLVQQRRGDVDDEAAALVRRACDAQVLEACATP